MEFKLTDEHIELIKLLKVLNLVDSGGEAKIRVSSGEAKVNGEVETRKRCKLKVGDTVEFADQTITIK